LSLDQLLEILVEDAADAGKAVTFVRRCGCDVEARPRALQRCLANLLDNALKYGGTAEVSADRGDGEVQVCIRDHGPGIPPDKFDQVLQPFARLDALPPQAVDGVGLGLTIAKTLAERNEAELVLSNHPQGGLEARVILRRGIAAKPARTRTQSRKRAAPKLVAT
jgi:signal transduction histidine kinase